MKMKNFIVLGYICASLSPAAAPQLAIATTDLQMQPPLPPVDSRAKVSSTRDTLDKSALLAKYHDGEVPVPQKKGRSSLFKALENTLKNNRELLAAQRELMAIHENHVEASAHFRPTVSFRTGYKTSDTSTTEALSNSSRTEHETESAKSYGIEVRQNIFRGFADIAALAETDLNIKAKWSDYEMKKQNILRDVAILYATLIAKKEEITHLTVLLENRRESVEVAREMYETGTVKPLDLAQAHAAYAETEAKLAKADADFVSLCAKFEEMTGNIIPSNLIVPDKMFDETISDEQAMAMALRSNPEIIAANHLHLAAMKAIKKQITEFVPSLDLSCGIDNIYDSSARKRTNSFKKPRHRSVSMALTATIPIYDGGTVRAEKRKLIEIATKAAINKELTIDKVKTEIKSVMAALKAAKQNLASAVKAVEMRILALHDTQEEYKAGVKIMNDVLEAQGQLFEARHIAVQAAEQYFVSQCKANALIGRMNAKHLRIEDSDFDYLGHFVKTKKKL
jgi:outer membrane protein TolC